MEDFTIVTAVTPDYVSKLKLTLPTWVIKPQFKDRKLLVYINGFKSHEELNWINDYFKDVHFVYWEAEKADSQRERMLSSFIYAADKVDTPFYVKLDADTFFVNDQDVFNDDDFQYDLVSHKWGYTKPAWWINELDNFFYDKNDKYIKDTGPKGHKRIQSICCLHRKSFVQEVIAMIGDRLPVPSHDTTLWYIANEMEDKSWKAKNLKRLGVSHCSRVKSIREGVCSYPIAARNAYLDKHLLDNVQVELTSYCQLRCDNCDRNCGLVPYNKDSSIMTTDQYWKFIEDSITLKKKWKRIDLIGGEPTTHPNLETIIEMTRIYKDFSPSTKVRLSTNGLGSKVKEVLKTLPKWVKVRNSEKSGTNNRFEAYNVAPIDLNPKVSVRACSIPWRCGIGLTRHGFFLCGAGASLAEVYGFDIGIMDLKDLNTDSIRTHMNSLCKYCGHSNVKTKSIIKKQTTSDSWNKAINNYKSDRLRRF